MSVRATERRLLAAPFAVLITVAALLGVSLFTVAPTVHAQPEATVTGITIDAGESPSGGGGVEVWQFVEITANWTAADEAAEGDGFTIELPENLPAVTDEFPLRDEERDEIVGECRVANTLLTCTFSDYVERYTEVSGWVRFEARVDASAEGQETFEFGTGEGAVIEVPVPGGPVRPSGGHEFPYHWASYKSVWRTAPDSLRLTWHLSITYDALPEQPGDVVIVDDLAGLELVEDGIFRVERAVEEEWTGTGPWHSLSAEEYQINEDPDWPLSITLFDVGGDDSTVYRVLYETELPAGTPDGTEVTNTAQLGPTEVSQSYQYFGGTGVGSGQEPEPEPSPTPEDPAPSPSEPTPSPTPSEPSPTPSEPSPTPSEPTPSPAPSEPTPSETTATPTEPSPSASAPAPSEPAGESSGSLARTGVQATWTAAAALVLLAAGASLVAWRRRSSPQA